MKRIQIGVFIALSTLFLTGCLFKNTLKRSELHLRAMQPRRAVAVAEHALKKDPLNKALQKLHQTVKERASNILYHQGKVHLESGKYYQATKDANTAIIYDPSNRKALLLLRRVQSEWRKSRANKLERQALQLATQCDYLQAIHILKKAQQIHKSIRRTASIKQFQKEYKAIDHKMSQIYLLIGKGQLHRALSLLQSKKSTLGYHPHYQTYLTEIRSQFAKRWIAQGEQQERQQKFALALASYQKAHDWSSSLAIRLKIKSVKQAAAQYNMERGDKEKIAKRLKKALDWYNKANQWYPLPPLKAKILSMRGILFYKQKQYQKAYRALHKSYRLDKVASLTRTYLVEASEQLYKRKLVQLRKQLQWLTNLTGFRAFSYKLQALRNMSPYLGKNSRTEYNVLLASAQKKLLGLYTRKLASIVKAHPLALPSLQVLLRQHIRLLPGASLPQNYAEVLARVSQIRSGFYIYIHKDAYKLHSPKQSQTLVQAIQASLTQAPISTTQVFSGTASPQKELKASLEKQLPQQWRSSFRGTAPLEGLAISIAQYSLEQNNTTSTKIMQSRYQAGYKMMVNPAYHRLKNRFKISQARCVRCTSRQSKCLICMRFAKMQARVQFLQNRIIRASHALLLQKTHRDLLDSQESQFTVASRLPKFSWSRVQRRIEKLQKLYVQCKRCSPKKNNCRPCLQLVRYSRHLNLRLKTVIREIRRRCYRCLRNKPICKMCQRTATLENKLYKTSQFRKKYIIKDYAFKQHRMLALGKVSTSIRLSSLHTKKLYTTIHRNDIQKRKIISTTGVHSRDLEGYRNNSHFGANSALLQQQALQWIQKESIQALRNKIHKLNKEYFLQKAKHYRRVRANKKAIAYYLYFLNNHPRDPRSTEIFKYINKHLFLFQAPEDMKRLFTPL